MKIARCTWRDTTSWCIVNTEERSARPFRGALIEWAPALTSGQGEHALDFTHERWTFDDIRFLAPADRGATVYVAGANFLKHLKEFGIEPPKSPFAFLKPYRALTGAYDPIPLSTLTHQLDFEVELVAVVGATLDRHSDPFRAVLGYTVGNDVSARDLQKGPGGAIGMDFLSGKGLDHATPVGPWIVTPDELGGGMPDLQLSLRVNGEQRQLGRTSSMTWNVGELLAYVNTRALLEPGDLLFTGTPEGVAQGDGRFLQLGDVVEASIERIGTLRNLVGNRADG